MATGSYTSPYSILNSNRRKALAPSIIGASQVLNPQPQANPGLAGTMHALSPTGNSITPTLPQNYGFNDLAGYEETRRKAYGDTSSADILKTRDELSKSLGDYGKKYFAEQNPAILEDLNSRGLLNSPSALSDAEATKLKEIALSNENYLRDFDTSALSARLQGGQDALDAGLDLRRGKLEGDLASSAADREEKLANSLADKQGRNQLTNSLIGVGGSLGSSLLTAKLLGAYGAKGVAASALPSIAPATPGILGGSVSGSLGGTAYAGGGLPASSMFPGGLGAVGTPTASGAVAGSSGAGVGGIPLSSAATASKFGPGGTVLNTAGTATPGLGNVLPGAAGYAAGHEAFKSTQAGDQSRSNIYSAVGGAGGSFFGPAGTFAGASLGYGYGKGINRIEQGAKKSLGTTGGTLVGAAIDPLGTTYDVGKKLVGGGHGHTDTKGSDAWAVNMDPTEYATKLGLQGYTPSFDSNAAGSYVNVLNQKIAELTPEQLVARYSAGTVVQGIPTDLKNKALFDKATTYLGRKPNPEEFASVLNGALA